MTPEARLDRLERIAKLFVKAGLRARSQSREQVEKINILINLQMQNEERFRGQSDDIKMLVNLQAQNEERFAQNEERFARTDERFAKTDDRFARADKKFAELMEAQAATGRRLDSLIDTLRQDRNGNT